MGNTPDGPNRRVATVRIPPAEPDHIEDRDGPPSESAPSCATSWLPNSALLPEHGRVAAPECGSPPPPRYACVRRFSRSCFSVAVLLPPMIPRSFSASMRDTISFFLHFQLRSTQIVFRLFLRRYHLLDLAISSSAFFFLCYLAGK